jgi:phenylacetate-CoA ligase
VLTTLTKEGQPLIRYRTRDITSLNYVPCKCGRTHVRMQRVTGRSDDMLIIRGVNVFPSQIETILLETEGTAPITSSSSTARAAWTRWKCAWRSTSASSPTRSRAATPGGQDQEVHQGVPWRIHQGHAGGAPGIERSVGKAQRIVDLRKKQ